MYLSSSRFRMLFLDLYLDYLARMLNHFGNICLMPPTNFSQNSFDEIGKASIHPEFPERTGALTKWAGICFDHTESSVDRPENEEDDKKVMRVPKALEIRTPKPLHRRYHHQHQANEHDVSRPAGTSGEVGREEPFKPLFIVLRELREIVPMRTGMEPSKEDNRPSYQFMERDVFVELDDPIYRCLPQ